MPQLDTSTWFTTITSSLITLFILMQLKVSSFTLTPAPHIKSTSFTQISNPWETKWTKIYSPLSLPLQ